MSDLASSTITSRSKRLDAGTIALVQDLLARFDGRRVERLQARAAHRARIAEGEAAFRADTASMRKADWKLPPMPEQVQERRVELIGGASRRELVDGLNAGAKCYIADLWNFTAAEGGSLLRAHHHLARAVRLDLAYMDDAGGRIRLNPATTTRLMVVPRPFHALDSGLLIGDEPVPGTFLDLALLMDRAANLVRRQGGLYLYLRDVQGQLDARLWSHVFDHLEEQAGLVRGSIRATVMVDNLIGALEAEEILFELRHHGAGLAFDAAGYLADHAALFSGADRPVLPDRTTIGNDAPLLRALSLHLIGVAHRRGCHAIAGPSFVLPPGERSRNKQRYADMLADLERQAADGHDGAIVVHRGTVNAAMIEFNKHMALRNQLNYQRDDAISAADLLRRPEGTITVEGLQELMRPALLALARGPGAPGWVVNDGRLHDRSALRLAIRMLWQWNHAQRGVVSATGLPIGMDLLRFMLRKEVGKLFAESDERTRRRAEAAMERLLEAVDGPAPPLEPMA